MSIEGQVQDLARKITQAGASERTRVFHMSWWSERMLDWAMANPAFKTQLFRFVDVFPACRDDIDVMRHLEEYFEGVQMPPALGLGLRAAPHLPMGKKVTGAVARSNITRMARQFIAGQTPAEALPQLEQLWLAGEAATVDLLGEKTVTDAEARRYASRVYEMITSLSAGTASWPAKPILESDPWGPVPRVNVSVKPSALTPFFTPLSAEEGFAQALERLRPTLEHAKKAGATVHLDTEHYDMKDMTFELLQRIGAAYPDGPQIGCVVQAYLKDSHADLRDLIAWSKSSLRTPLQIRLVKGAYWDYETVHAQAEGWPVPVYERKPETDANYERCITTMVDAAGTIRPAFASHNVRSLACAIASARDKGLDDSAFELQLLYGMAEPIHAALRSFGLRVRVYAPVGELVPGMAYLVRRLLENTSNESFIRHRFAEGKDLDDLVAPPDADQAALPEPGGALILERETDASDPEPFDNEPYGEWRSPEHRDSIGSAVARTPKSLGFEAPLIIGGRRVRTSGEIVSVDPADPTVVVCRSAQATIADAELAVEIALGAFPSWSRTRARDRARVLFRAASLMRRRRYELAALMIHEAGKPWPEADADVAEAIDFCEYYGREAIRLGTGAPLLQPPGETNAYQYRARGVGVVISPWNFPLAIPAGMTVAALAAGNCVILKPAEQTPGLALRLVEILLEAGLPPGALAYLPGYGEEVGAHLVEHAQIGFIAFTGSKSVGLQIVERAAIHRPGQRAIKRVVAELGGKNAVIVDSDADLDQAVPGIISSAFAYAGQKCSAASRIIGIGRMYDELADRLVGAGSVVPVGHPREMRTVVGPVIDADAHSRVKGYQELAAKEGDVLLQREDVPDKGWFIGPTLVAVDNPSCRMVNEEVFGPVAALMKADDFDHALSLANESEYALTGGLFSRSPVNIRRATEEFRAGNLYINRGITGALVGRQPFGGFGMSGVGSKAGGPDYLLQFVEPRVVTENTVRQGFAPLDD
ncbi:MAG TPA: L-glutamate gamma-semialdehyde dehydrogenase [Actinomycetota bacterium]|nr:L-glutamate gamma-semialdehyde dehydrogenase [Actinomycetota bacterium]